jgi:hypothetical protein
MTLADAILQTTNTNDIRRFQAFLVPKDTCILFYGARNKKGYGIFGVRDQTILAHRFAYLIAKGVIPSDKHVLHKCDIPNCCNPDHLYLGDELDNAMDRNNRNRGNQPHGQQHHWAKLTDAEMDQVALRCRTGENTKIIAQEFGITRRHVCELGQIRKVGQ